MLLLLTHLLLLLGAALARSPVHPSKETFFHGFINDTLPSAGALADPSSIAFQHVTLSGWRSTEVRGVSCLQSSPPEPGEASN